MPTQTNKESGWYGWVYFAGILMIVRSFFQAFLGFVALTKDDFYVVTSDHLAVFNFTAWGWVHLGLALVLFTAGFSVFSGNMWGRLVGVVMASLSLFANLVFLPAYPIWSIVAIAIDALIIYALVVKAGELKDPR